MEQILRPKATRSRNIDLIQNMLDSNHEGSTFKLPSLIAINSTTKVKHMPATDDICIDVSISSNKLDQIRTLINEQLTKIKMCSNTRYLSRTGEPIGENNRTKVINRSFDETGLQHNRIKQCEELVQSGKHAGLFRFKSFLHMKL